MSEGKRHEFNISRVHRSLAGYPNRRFRFGVGVSSFFFSLRRRRFSLWLLSTSRLLHQRCTPKNKQITYASRTHMLDRCPKIECLHRRTSANKNKTAALERSRRSGSFPKTRHRSFLTSLWGNRASKIRRGCGTVLLCTPMMAVK